MKRQSGQCAAVVWSFESFCVVGSPRHLVVALRSDVGSPCVHLWIGGGGGVREVWVSLGVCVCVDSTSPWTLAFV